jgi:hypothetical protein
MKPQMIEYELKNYEIDPIVETSNDQAAQGFFSILSLDLDEFQKAPIN